MARREAARRCWPPADSAYETLRDGAVAALVRQAATPEGRRLAERLQALVRDRVGAVGVGAQRGPGQLGGGGRVPATGGPSSSRRALVDQALESLGAEIEALWA